MTEQDRLSVLFGGLREDPAGSFDGPGSSVAEASGRRRRTRRRLVVAAVAVVVLIVGGVAGWGATEPDTLRPILPATASPSAPPSGSPSSGSPSSGKVTSLRATDWKNAVVNLPRYGVCDSDRLRFSDGAATGENAMKYRMLPRGSEPEYGDVTGDGVEDAVIAIDCVGSGDGNRVTEYQPAVVAYSENANGGPRLLGLVADINPQSTGPRYWIEDDAIVVDHNKINSSEGVHTYRWSGTRFAEVP